MEKQAMKIVLNFLKRIKCGFAWRIYWNVAKFLPCSFMRGGRFAKWLRAACCRQFLKHVGQNANIERGVYLGGINISLGDNSGLGVNSNIYGSVTIGDDVMMGPECDIHSGCHEFSRTDIPMWHQGFKPDRPVTIGNDVWIGSRVTILPGVKIGNGVVIGANSVVTKDIPDWAVAVGNPAVVKKFRK